MNKNLIYLLLVVLLFIEGFTSVNLWSHISMKKEYLSYNYLKDGVESDHFDIIQVSKNSYLTLTYNPLNNFFLLDDVDGIRKINGKGQEKAYIQTRKLNLVHRTHFAFTDSLVFDFSNKEVKPETFSKIIFPEGRSENDWMLTFRSYYNKASIVIYGDKLVDQEHDFDPIYMKIDNKWVLMYLHGYFHFQLNANKERMFENFVGKYDQLILLKDEGRHGYSDWLSYDFSKEQIEESMEYSHQKIKTLSFQKSFVSDRIVYTPIPVNFAGTAYYQLKKDSDPIRFKENAFRGIFPKVNSYLFHFSLPKKYDEQSDVSFLKLAYPSNINESGSEGWYVIRRK